MAPSYKLTYFNSRGLAEPIRLIFALKGVEYQDIRIEKEQYPALKPTLKQPFGKLPILEFDGNVLAESRAIARYLANEFGLAGKNNIEKARTDGLVDGVGDLFMALGTYHREEDAAKKEALKKTLVSETVPNALVNYQNLLKKNGTGFFVGDGVTWADLTVMYGLQTLLNFYPNLLEKFPELNQFVTKISTIPAIKAWIEKRPKTEF